MQSAGARTECRKGSEWVQRAVKRISSLSDIYSNGKEKEGKNKKNHLVLHPSSSNLFAENREDAWIEKTPTELVARVSHSLPISVRGGARGSLQEEGRSGAHICLSCPVGFVFEQKPEKKRRSVRCAEKW